MTTPIRVAFCPLLYLENGGILEFDAQKRPIFSNKKQYIKGKCDEAYDCGECSVLRRWLQKRSQEGYIIGWECVQCLKDTKSVPRWLPGYFQSSKYRGPLEDRVLVEPERPIDGCTRCDYGSITLQLVLRKQ
jgi:hypothetical protein